MQFFIIFVGPSSCFLCFCFLCQCFPALVFSHIYRVLPIGTAEMIKVSLYDLRLLCLLMNAKSNKRREKKTKGLRTSEVGTSCTNKGICMKLSK